MWKCLYLPWHKLSLFQRAKEPYRGKKIKCSCGKFYVMHEPTRTFLPYDDDFAEYYNNPPEAS